MNDIKTIHELDDSLNQRVIIIKDEPSLDIVTSSNKEQSYYHCNYFRKYLESSYLEDPILQMIAPKISVADGIVTANIICYMLKQYNSVIFTETTQDFSNERYAILYLPDEIKKEQYKLIEDKLKEYLTKFTSVLIQGELKNKNGLPEANFCKEVKQENIDEIFEILQNITEEEKRK